VAAARTLENLSGVHSELEDGLVSFDRARESGRLISTGVPSDRVDDARGLDIAGLRRLTASLRHMTRAGEREVFESRFVAIQPNLDSSSYRLWGQLPGTDGETVSQALTTRADTFPSLPDGTRGSIGQRSADALVSIARDSLTSTSGNPESSGPVLSVFTTGTGSTAETGVSVGPAIVEELLCAGIVEHTHVENGQPLAVGRRTRVISPRLRSFIMWRDGGCAADGCTSRYRLQAHHRLPWSEGGATDPANLTTLCCRFRRLRPPHQVTIVGDDEIDGFTIMSSYIKWATPSTLNHHPNDCGSSNPTHLIHPDILTCPPPVIGLPNIRHPNNRTASDRAIPGQPCHIDSSTPRRMLARCVSEYAMPLGVVSDM
jgi:hypothetical protein